MKSYEIITILAIAGLLILVIWGIATTPQENKLFEQRQLQKVEDCKTKTTDVDWCYKNFYKNYN